MKKQWAERVLGVEELTTDTWVAVLTWAAVSVICLHDLIAQGAAPVTVGIAAGLLMVYIVALLAVATRRVPSPRRAWLGLGLEAAAVIGLYLVSELAYLAILMVIWSAQLSWFVGMRLALAAAVAASLPLLLVHIALWASPQAGRTWLLFALFNVFAAVMMQLLRREQAASQALTHSQQEIEAARDMLTQAGREAEQMRLRMLHGDRAPVEPLTEREQEVLRLAASGCSNRRIAEILCRSEGTIKNHFTVIFGKLGVSDRTQAVVKALSQRLLVSRPADPDTVPGSGKPAE